MNHWLLFAIFVSLVFGVLILSAGIASRIAPNDERPEDTDWKNRFKGWQ